MLEHETVDDQHILPLPVAVSVQVKPPCVHEAVQPLLVTDEVTLADVLHQCPQLLLPVNPGHSHLHLLPLQPPPLLLLLGTKGCFLLESYCIIPDEKFSVAWSSLTCLI